MRILVVDDVADIQVLLVAVLQRAGFEVIEAADGTTVESWVRDSRPDLIILDLMMPGMDGWDTLELLKSNPESIDIPVIISSALSEDEDFDKAREMGAVDYVPKPWSADDLIARVNKAVEASQQAA
ncbi:response regulator [Candidatus Lucifugimonas marina]|jgi:DNA-binding response OmpR family regulator|uniref:Response regulator n=1 Tax=Candidatus Lucifugimonas marina TaxID=3038979 RepID=A0AAJ5ZJR0_9CHLR|nr:response regulator [SAR202 cluster bacterium JH702]MDG0870400.1 response regulator [SAR202 cluster bacterium JH639]WFG36047.1 response regulator [SAR202 cluster bacterium JH545]WFG39992.1 response regulator [SAR202 cluster bacterium JH1073]